ncbi:MAG: cell division protein FtsH, partial [Treponema sp.]|nr:cell division protein FtsH [Treponema sp.]
ITYGQEDEPIFIGKEIARHKEYSEDTARRIDAEVAAILERQKKIAEAIIHEHKAELEKLADALIAQETLTDDEVRVILHLPPREDADSSGPGAKGP